MESTRVVLVGRSLLADSLRRVFEDLAGFVVVGCVESLEEVLERTDELRPDVLIFPGDGPKALQDLGRLLDLQPGLTVIRADPRDDTVQFLTGQRVAANLADLLAKIDYISLGS